MSRKMVTMTATFLSIYTALTFVSAMAFTGDVASLELAYSGTQADERRPADNIKSKSSNDEIGILANTLQISRSNIETEDGMKNQTKQAKEVYRDEQEEIEQQRKAAEETLVKQADIKYAQEARAAAQGNILTSSIDPIYDNDGKLVIRNSKEAALLDIRVPSNWDYEDFKVATKESIHPLIPVVMQIEAETGVNAVYLISSVAAETGWGTQLAAKNNYFNWSTTGESYYPFETMQDVTSYTIKRYENDYSDPGFYSIFTTGNQVPDVITLKVVNIAYAKFHDGSINWKWSAVIADIMAGISESRIDGKCIYEQ